MRKMIEVIPEKVWVIFEDVEPIPTVSKKKCGFLGSTLKTAYGNLRYRDNTYCENKKYKEVFCDCKCKHLLNRRKLAHRINEIYKNKKKLVERIEISADNFNKVFYEQENSFYGIQIYIGERNKNRRAYLTLKLKKENSSGKD